MAESECCIGAGVLAHLVELVPRDRRAGGFRVSRRRPFSRKPRSSATSTCAPPSFAAAAARIGDLLVEDRELGTAREVGSRTAERVAPRLFGRRRLTHRQDVLDVGGEVRRDRRAPAGERCAASGSTLRARRASSKTRAHLDSHAFRLSR